MITIFCQVTDAGMIQRVWEEDVPDVGPAPRMPVPRPGTRYETLAQPFSLHAPPTPTSLARLVAGLPTWEETAPLSELKVAAIAKTFVDVDAVVTAAVGEREGEYEEAAAAARAWAATGYIGVPAEDVSAYATFNGTGLVQTNRWAADTILARADAFRVARRSMRSTRFERQCGMQAASTAVDLAAVVAQWDSFIDGLRAQLGLPPKGTA